MKKDISRIGILILTFVFILFYIITTFFLDRRNLNKNVNPSNDIIKEENISYDNEKNIVNNLYQNVRILYDVINNKFKVSQEDTITIGDVVYKKITNFNDVMDEIFTSNGIDKYIHDLGSYFAHTDSGYYLAGNLVSYQTYYFRGDSSNIFITDVNDSEINGIIYERWINNNKNTLALIKVVYKNDKWLIDNIDILATE